MYKNKAVVIHNGALGDRLLIWPFLRAFAARCNDKAERPFFYGRPHNADWQRALGYAPCPPDLRRAVDALYAGRADTEPQGARCIWLCVDKTPFAAPQGADITWLFSAAAGGKGHAASAVLEQAMDADLLPRKDVADLIQEALQDWRTLFGGPLPMNERANAPVLLFPGAGSPAKSWPLENFMAVAKALRAAGRPCVWVFGPAEEERGLAPPEGEIIHRPGDMAELSGLLCNACFALGNDSGPMHLAAMHGVPLLALFGPTAPGVWRPLSGDILTSPEGLAGVSTERVLERVLNELG